MPWFEVLWNDDLIEHLAEHDLTPDDFEFVLFNPTSRTTSDSSGRPAAFGYTEEGRHIMIVYEEIGADTVVPVTAFDVPRRRR